MIQNVNYFPAHSSEKNMGKTIYAEENLLCYLKALSKLGTCSTGLILGQSVASKYYIVLLVRTPEQKDDETYFAPAGAAVFQTIKDINETWVANHAKQVTKMLPGGMFVLGAFVCSPADIFSDSSTQSKAKSLLFYLNKVLASDPVLCSNNSISEKLLLHFNTVDFRYNCKILNAEVKNSDFKSADLKFQNNYTKWCKIQCNFDLSQPPFGGNLSCPVKDQLKAALTKVNESLKEALVVFNNQVKNLEDDLENVVKKEIINSPNNELSLLKADIFLPYNKKKICENIKIRDCDVELHLLGVLASQVFLSQKATVAEAVNAIKQDIIRSLAARFEMHCDSLVEEEYGSPEEKLSVHEPPRRVLVTLPQNKLAFSDYLFPGEGAVEVISSFKEMLDIDINEANLEKEAELQGDPMEFYGKSTMNFSTSSSNNLLGPSFKGVVIIIFSVAIVIIAIVISLFNKLKKES